MKSVTVTVQIQLDVPESGNTLQHVVERLSNVNDLIYDHNSCGDAQIFVNSIDNSDILDTDSE